MRKNLESITTRQNIDALKAPGGDRSQLALCEAFESLTSRLDRSPTLKELSFELSMKDPSFNVDKVRRTLAQINARSNNGLLKTTPGRPDIVYEALVKDLYLKYLADNAEPPTREQFRAALEAHNCFIPHATVLSILKRAREATEPADYQWRLLKTTSLIPARDLVEA